MSQTDTERRKFLGAVGGLGVATTLSHLISPNLAQASTALYSAKRGVYLNTGTTGVMPSNVLSVLDQGYREYASNPTYASTDSPYLGAWQINGRKSVGRYLDTDYKNLVLTNNTTMGLHIVLNGLTLKEGDEIITTNHEHLSLDSPLWVIARRFKVNIKVVYIPSSVRSQNDVLSLFKKALSPKTRLACFSHVAWTNGLRFPVNELCEFFRNKQVLTLVDGAHALGMIPLQIKEMKPDFYAASGHKWLNGPPGTGILYINPAIDNFWSTLSEFEHIRSHAPNISLTDSMQVRGQVDTPALAGMIEALNLYLQFNPKQVEQKILNLSDYVRDKVVKKWGESSLLSQTSSHDLGLKSGIISFVPSENANDAFNEEFIESINNRLKSEFNIWVRTVKYYRNASDRAKRKRTHALRLCTHYHNHTSDIDLALESIASIVS